MWATEWATSPGSGPLVGGRSRMDAQSVDLVYGSIWIEHCIECAIPECYATCPLYVRRRDTKCARLRYGIYPNRSFQGLFDFGADVHFRRWGKLESKLTYRAASPARIRRLAAQDRAILSFLSPVAAGLGLVDPKHRLVRLYEIAREQRLARSARDEVNMPRFDDFIVEVHNPNPQAVSLIIELHQGHLRFRDSLLLEPGQSLHRIPVATMDVDLSRRDGKLLVYPENDAEVRLVFTWLDFVRYASSGAGEVPASQGMGPPTAVIAGSSDTERPGPAAKVKCVAWDLDNTVWTGTLIEDGPEALTLRPEVVETIRQLDDRGILNTIVSKNDMRQAWAKIAQLGLNEYFVQPAINWGTKSANLRAVAEALNIGVDTFALIDDSPFERGEVQSELPQVRVFAETEIDRLLSRPEFDVPITEETRQRRLSYQSEETRQTIAASFGDNYDEFLKSCEIRMVVFHPESREHQDRALELVQRSNQLNLSTRRYSREEFDSLLHDAAKLTLVWSCGDRYGNYGTVGFLSVSMAEDPPVLTDLVISCRVAKKKVENALFQWLGDALAERGVATLRARYVPTPRNHVLLDSLDSVGFVPLSELDGTTVLELRLGRDVPGGTVVQVDADGVQLPARGVV